MKKMLKSVKGFTLIELMVVIIIVGILSAVAVPVYNAYTTKARFAEAHALCGAIVAAGEVYFAQNGDYTTWTTPTAQLVVSPAGNKYFTTYALSAQVKGPPSSYQILITGAGSEAGHTLTLTHTEGTPDNPTTNPLNN